MQKEGTLRFWDEYHGNNTNKEWILHPTDTLLQSVAQQIPAFHQEVGGMIRILEIGCGTSTFARDLWLYLLQKSSDQQKNLVVHVCATDISPVSIEFCRDRDQKWIHDATDDSSRLEYKCLDVLMNEEGTFPPLQHWDLILDKGCLDTLLFRSRRQRGENRKYPQCLEALLNNIWSWLVPNNGVYLLLSPRKKNLALKDFAGFVSVCRLPLDSPQQAALVPARGEKKNVDTVVEMDNKPKRKPVERQCTHAWICRKDLSYVPDQDACWQNGRLTADSLPPKDSICPKCKISFDAFRQGSDNSERENAYWGRVWKQHQNHCK